MHGPLERPSSLVIWGPNRAFLDEAALSLARSVGPEFYWFDIVSPDDPTAREEENVLSEIPPERACRVGPPEIELQNAIGNLALWAVLDIANLEGSEVRDLTDFIRMPEAVQRAVGAHDPRANPAVLVASNADRARRLYRPEAGTFTPFIELLNKRGITLLLTNGGTPRANVFDFEIVLHFEERKDGTPGFLCVKGFAEGGFPPFRQDAWTPRDELLRLLAGFRGPQGT